MALPTIAREGVARSAANIDSTWIGLEVECFLTDRLGRPVHALNDADAAGLAEVRYGAGRGPEGRPARGTVLVLLLGTGIGSALFVDGWLVPNLELGHLEFLLSPDLIVVGGAISARHEDFLPHLHLDTPIVPAQLSNAAGIIGAARQCLLHGTALAVAGSPTADHRAHEVARSTPAPPWTWWSASGGVIRRARAWPPGRTRSSSARARSAAAPSRPAASRNCTAKPTRWAPSRWTAARPTPRSN